MTNNVTPRRHRQRRRRRATRRTILLFGGLTLCLALLLLPAVIKKLFGAVGTVPALAGSFSQSFAAASPASGQALLSATLTALQALLPRHPGLAQVLENPSAYPLRLLEAAAGNEELIPFVLGWPQRETLASADEPLTEDLQPGNIPLLFQWDARWGYAEYCGGFIALDGCGPVCLSMVAAGLTGNAAHSPLAIARFAQQNGYATPGVGTAWELMTEGSAAFGLTGTETPLDENVMKNLLRQGSPIICSMRPGSFTTTGHFIVLVGLAENGDFLVHDPNSAQRSARSWGYGEISDQIKNLWAFTAAG